MLSISSADLPHRRSNHPGGETVLRRSKVKARFIVKSDVEQYIKDYLKRETGPANSNIICVCEASSLCFVLALLEYMIVVQNQHL
jgi:hypothetical protein